MFGTTKIKTKKRTFYYGPSNDRGTIIYSAKGKYLFQYRIIYSLCSITIVQSMITGYKLTKREKETIGIALDYLLNYKLMVSFQNVTKNSYDHLIAGGFIDYARLPGSYTEGIRQSSMKAKTDNCIALMVKSSAFEKHFLSFPA